MKKDDIWKNVIVKFFKDFTSFFMPELHNDIDFTHKFNFIETELGQISIKSQRKKRIADKLVEVKLKDGTEHLVLIHIEVQSYNDENFASRMYKYQYRAFDKYKKNVIAIAIFIDNEDNYIPDNFYSSLYGTKIHYEYNIYKVLAQKEEELKNNDNPFSLVVLSSLYYLKAKKNQKKKLNYKLKLIELLAEKNYTGEEIEELFDFIDLLINFKDYKFDYKFYEELDKMPKVQEKKEIGGFKKVLIKKEKLEIAKNLKNLGVEIEKISIATGLSIQEIENL